MFRRAARVDKVMSVPGEVCYPRDWPGRPRSEMRLSFGVQSPDGIREGMRRLASSVRWALETGG